MKPSQQLEIERLKRHLRKALTYADWTIRQRRATMWNEPSVEAEVKWIEKAKLAAK